MNDFSNLCLDRDIKLKKCFFFTITSDLKTLGIILETVVDSHMIRPRIVYISLSLFHVALRKLRYFLVNSIQSIKRVNFTRLSAREEACESVVL